MAKASNSIEPSRLARTTAATAPPGRALGPSTSSAATTTLDEEARAEGMALKSELRAAKRGVEVDIALVENSEPGGVDEVRAKIAGDGVESGLGDVWCAVSVTICSRDGLSEVVSCCGSGRGSAVEAGSGSGWLVGSGAMLDSSAVEGAVGVEGCSDARNVVVDSGAGVGALLAREGSTPLDVGLPMTVDRS